MTDIGGPAAGAGHSIGAALRAAAMLLASSGVANPRRDAQVLLEAVLGVGPEVTFGAPERPIGAAAAVRFRDFVERRRRGEPVSRIRGTREFWGLPFVVTPAVLDPRPDSEAVVEAALRCVADRGAPCAVLDLGTGSGCLLLALLSELPAAAGVGLDISAAAVAVARRNAVALGLARRAGFVVGSWGEALAQRFDVVVANPPYIVRHQIAGLMAEVAHHDPVLALDGGGDGLMAYRALAPGLPRLIRASGSAVLEIGWGQQSAVTKLLARRGLRTVDIVRDLAGHPRALVVRAAGHERRRSEKGWKSASSGLVSRSDLGSGRRLGVR